MTYGKIKLDSLTKAIAPYSSNRPTRPTRGWLRAVREALGLSLEDVGRAAKLTRQGVADFERAEGEDKITLASLRRVADAMNCDVVYALLPKSGSFADLAEHAARERSTRAEEKARQEASELVRAVDHSMALEGQSTNRLHERIDEETKRILKRRMK